MKTKSEIIEINKIQKEFYNQYKMNFATKLWAKIRHGLLADIRHEIGMSNQVYEKHKIWLGDLSNKKVLDLGCYAGNALTIYLAKNSKEYIGIDLSNVAIAQLNERLKNIPSAKAIAADFLSDGDFPDNNFDLIYAYGVLHHFSNFDLLIEKLNEKLAPNGEIISYDPLETSIPIKILRAVYRPFQSDAAWEWPFTKNTIRKLNNEFEIIEKRGLLGKTKWMFLLNLLPINKSKRLKIGKKWHNHDWEMSLSSNNAMYKCMHLTMLMKKK